MTISELLTDASKWTKESYARDNQGRSVSAASSAAVCWCLLGALKRCYDDVAASGIAEWKLKAAIARRRRNGAHVVNLAGWNDRFSRTFAEVKAVIEEADV